MRSLVLLALLFAFIGLSNAITMDPKKDLQSEIDLVLQSFINKDVKLYLELVQPTSSFDVFMTAHKDTIANIQILDAKFMDDIFSLVQGVGIVYMKSQSDKPFYLRLGMFKREQSRTGYMMYDALDCDNANCASRHV